MGNRKSIVIILILLGVLACSKYEIKEEHYPNGNLLAKGELKDDKLHGVFQEYYEEGQLKRSLNYQNGLLNGNATDYYSNGMVKRKYGYSNDTLEGPVEIFFDDGNLNKTFKYLNGKIDGDLIEYDSLGNLYTTTTYQDGVKTWFKVYHPNGKLFIDEEREGELRNGKYTVYFEDGTIDEVGEYEDGDRIGWFVRNYSNGSIKDSVLFKEGKWQIAHQYDSLGEYIISKKNLENTPNQ
ncbi:MAG: toxin-antitoxin system YwqK family antitoxin [Marinoscillum sp.]|uniref:toxin-antitoxin system YwqK family antitoxin n=1 Tax=Marinoscillum sp. TaxID=2024838 RepID=UPI0032F111AF